jgi:hypothetical protein
MFHVDRSILGSYGGKTPVYILKPCVAALHATIGRRPMMKIGGLTVLITA